jgi:hypothetical protein
VEEISSNELKKAMIRMMYEFKEEMYKKINELKQDTNKQLK